METKHITADCRLTPGGTAIHHVYGFDGERIGTRHSRHRYAYAICKRYPGARVEVVRWSRSASTSGTEFAVAIEDV